MLLFSSLIGRKREARLSREKRLSVKVCRGTFLHHTQKFSENAADRPDVDSRAVFFFKEDKLGCSVPSCDDVTRQFSLKVFTLVFSSFQSLSHELSLLSDCHFALRFSCFLCLLRDRGRLGTFHDDVLGLLLLALVFILALFDNQFAAFNSGDASSKSKVTDLD